VTELFLVSFGDPHVFYINRAIRLADPLRHARRTVVRSSTPTRLGARRVHDRMPGQHSLDRNPNAKLHFTPTYSSWLNQVEIWFARLEREVIARGIFTSVQDLSRKLMRYIRAYSKTARPFKWNTPTFEGESSHANELAATGY
jgi:transposase